ncbi:MAG TPA: stage II sporulation protein P [bacterium]|jgi:stage II sporulation protein P|nr:stage II sporulation protein P [bacterium]
MRWAAIIKRGRLALPFMKGVLLVTIMFFMISLAVIGKPYLGVLSPPVVPALAHKDQNKIRVGWLSSILDSFKMDYMWIVSQELPLSCWYQSSDPGRTNNFLFWLYPNTTRLKLGLQPLDLMQAEFGWFQVAARGGHRCPSPSEPENVGLDPAQDKTVSEPTTRQMAKSVITTIAKGPARVAIYHTHTCEDYVSTCGHTHTYDREAGIVAVGRKLTQELETKHDICCVHDTTVHDADVFREAYLRSADTVAELLKRNPNLDVVLDIHRDAPSRDNEKSRRLTTVEIGGEQVGRVYIIVGTDQLGLEHPNWHQNYAFAVQLQEQLERSVPGLSRGIKTDQARFNQHLHPQLLLIEIGGDQNTVEEAMLGAEYLALALKAWLDRGPEG